MGIWPDIKGIPSLTTNGVLITTGGKGGISVLANSVGWLHNDGAGALSYSTPSYSDVGALALHGTADDSSKLGAQLPSYYFGGTAVTNASFGLGNGVTSVFRIPNASAVTAVYWTDWQGKQLLYTSLRTNLGKYTESLDTVTSGWVTVRASISPNVIAHPRDGLMTVNKVVESTAASNSHYTRQDVVLTAGHTYIASIRCKKGERYAFFMSINGRALSRALFNVDSGIIPVVSPAQTFVLASGIVDEGGGFYRCWTKWTYDGTGTAIMFELVQGDATGNYTGDGVSGLYFTDYQLEDVDVATSGPSGYIQNTTSSPASVTDYSISAVPFTVTLGQVPILNALLTYDGTNFDSRLTSNFSFNTSNNELSGGAVRSFSHQRRVIYPEETSIIEADDQKIVYGSGYKILGEETVYGSLFVLGLPV